jgi:TolA-binding protein
MLDVTYGFVRRTSRLWLFSLTTLLIGVAPLFGQAKVDPAAQNLLNSARKAYNDRNYPVATAQFREFLTKFPRHDKLPEARYGLALALVEGPEKNYLAAAEQLQLLAAKTTLPEHGYVLYYLGMCRRGLGTKEIAAAKPEDLARRRAKAAEWFAEAGKQFAAARRVFLASSKTPDPKVSALPIEHEWAARARCDEAEMELRLGRGPSAKTTAAPFLKDPILVGSRYRGLGLYYHGFACFLLKDYNAAGRSLNMLAPFTSSAYATHARYLLARTHHVQDELAEAAADYEGVLADYARFKQQAALALGQPDKLKNDPDEKARLEGLVRDPVPDHVARAAYFSGEILYEGGKTAEAHARFASFPKDYPKSSLLLEAQLRRGFCEVHLRQFADALKTLQPLADKEPRFADRALFWIGKAQAGGADPNNPQAHAQGLKTAMDTYRKAATAAERASTSDPDARRRRGEILLELADTQQLARQHSEAARTYAQIRTDKLLGGRDQEVLERQVAAGNLAGDHDGSEKLCAEFQKAYPRSPLLPAVLFRHAENAHFLATAAETDPKLADRPRALAVLFDEAEKRYRDVVEGFPEFKYVNRARYARALIFYKRGDLAKARDFFKAIPSSERNGDLVTTSYLLADCFMRLAPARADDALAAGKLQEELQAATELLETFVGAQPAAPQAPEALLKLGLCQQRLAALFVKPEDRNKVLQNARTAYEKIINQFAQHPLQPQAILERAKCQALAGDKQGAINELRRFTNDNRLKAASVAPLAVVQMTILLREDRKGDEAAKLIDECRNQHEKNLLADKERSSWAGLLRYQQGMALKEAGKQAAAREIFSDLIKAFPSSAEATKAILRRGQCLREEALGASEAARKRLTQGNLKPADLAAIRQALAEALKSLHVAAEDLASQASVLKEKEPSSEIRARMLYDAAWSYRELASTEAELSRAQAAVNETKVSPFEAKARQAYVELIEACADSALAHGARLELAELYAAHNENEPAIKLLDEAIDKEPPAELTEKMHLLQGTCYLANRDYKSALAQLDAVTQNPKSVYLAHAHYRAGECLYGMKDYAKAAARLAIFRDQGPYQNVVGVTDWALLRLGQTYAELKQWDLSRQACEHVVGRFGTSALVGEARLIIGQAYENQKQYDSAVNVYNQITAATAAEPAARAQFRIGHCRLEQKRYPEATAAFLAVTFTYDYPDWTAAALCEAARSLVEEKKTADAERLLRKVVRDHPRSKWLEVAKNRLAALPRR